MLTVVDACLVVVTPLLVQRIVDDGIAEGNVALVAVLALAMAGVAVVERRCSRWSPATSPRGSVRA